MDIGELKQYLNTLTQSLKPNQRRFLRARLASLVSVFPFSEYEYILMFLSDRAIITFREYEELRERYVSSNRYLDLYGIAPRIFGEVWAHRHIMDIDSRFEKPSKDVDPSYDGEYDLWIDGVKVEVKSCRAINTKKRGALNTKALAYDSHEPFWMNYQQIKADMADVFIFIGVWTDNILYWVMSAEEIKKNKHLSLQHRGGIEQQIGITHNNIGQFDIYRVQPGDIADAVIRKGRTR